MKGISRVLNFNPIGLRKRRSQATAKLKIRCSRTAPLSKEETGGVFGGISLGSFISSLFLAEVSPPQRMVFCDSHGPPPANRRGRSQPRYAKICSTGGMLKLGLTRQLDVHPHEYDCPHSLISSPQSFLKAWISGVSKPRTKLY